MRQRRILITAGGTGGHIYPALSLAEELSEQGHEILLAGHGLKRNAFLQKTHFPREDVLSGTVSLRRPFKSLVSLFKLLRGTIQAFRLLRRFRPEVVVGFGSYHTLPLLIAGKILCLPIVIHEQNAFPGRVNRLVAPFAERVGLHFLEAKEYLKGNCTWVGMPLRRVMRRAEERAAAANYFAIDKERSTLLVFGGSLGAKHLNALVAKAISKMSEKVQLIHLTGGEEERQRYSSYYKEMGIDAVVKSFEERMEMAWAAADFAITRAGAVTIAELVEQSVPTITIPYPKAQDNHQELNAKALFRKTAGGVSLREEGLTADRLKEAIECVRAHSTEMRTALKEFRKERPKFSLSALVMEVLE